MKPIFQTFIGIYIQYVVSSKINTGNTYYIYVFCIRELNELTLTHEKYSLFDNEKDNKLNMISLNGWSQNNLLSLNKKCENLKDIIKFISDIMVSFRVLYTRICSDNRVLRSKYKVVVNL
jgi:hypothetical protein